MDPSPCGNPCPLCECAQSLCVAREESCEGVSVSGRDAGMGRRIARMIWSREQRLPSSGST